MDDDGNTVPNSQPFGPKWLTELLGIDFFDGVVRVHLNNTEVTDKGLEHLKGLTILRNLWLPHTQIT